MLCLSLAYFKGKIQAREVCVAVFEHFQDSQPMAVVFESAMVPHAGIKGCFAGVPKRRMPKVMCQGDGFGQVFVQTEVTGDGSANLSHFEGMCQSRPVMIVGFGDQHLGLVHEPAKGGAMNDAVAIARIQGAIRMRFFGMPPTLT
jgi:hypothetical protein